MSYKKAMQYFECIEPIKAEETLVALNVSSYPQSKKTARQKYEKRLKQIISSFDRKNEPQKSTEQLYEHLLRTLGNG